MTGMVVVDTKVVQKNSAMVDPIAHHTRLVGLVVVVDGDEADIGVDRDIQTTGLLVWVEVDHSTPKNRQMMAAEHSFGQADSQESSQQKDRQTDLDLRTKTTAPS